MSGDFASRRQALVDTVCAPLERPARLSWWASLCVSAGALAFGAWSVASTLRSGLGAWGVNDSVAWALDVTSFVFWIGIAHAGTALSALLLLAGGRSRGAMGRAAETMAVVALGCAAVLPVLHLGRPWLAFWNFPYPNSRGPLWVNFSSPLIWDFFAIAAYVVVSGLLWYVGLLPDLASLRSRAPSRWRRALYGALALGWDGSSRTWSRQQAALRLLAAIAVPTFLLTSSVVAADFAVTVVPGWSTALLYPYFVAGALFSGLAVLLAGAVVVRRVRGLEAVITHGHLSHLARAIAALGVFMLALYAAELATARWSGQPALVELTRHRAGGPGAWAWWGMLACNLLGSQVLWLPKVRSSPRALLAASVAIALGMWLERFVIVVSSLERGFVPATWADYAPTVPEVGVVVGGFGLFATSVLLLARAIPPVALAELDATSPEAPSGDSRQTELREAA